MTFHSNPELSNPKIIFVTHPDLSIDGWRHNSGSLDCPYSSTRFPTRREMLLDSKFIAQISTAVEYIRHHGIGRRLNSYALKHYAESWGASVGMSQNVTNGCAILAALLAGYTPLREKNSPNCKFQRI